MYVTLIGDTVVTTAVTVFSTATVTVMNLAQSANTSLSGLMVFLINLQQTLESSKRVKQKTSDIQFYLLMQHL